VKGFSDWNKMANEIESFSDQKDVKSAEKVKKVIKKDKNIV
jgi:hypothetical protein